MATLELTYPDFMRAIGRFLGYLDEDDDYTNLTTAEDSLCNELLQAGYRRFINPPRLDQRRPAHRWSFLSPNATLALVSSDYDYDLPADFGSMRGPFTLSSTTQAYAPIPLTNVARVVAMHVGTSLTAFPHIAGIRPKSHDGTATARQEALFYPTPDGSYTLNYQYNVQVNTLTAAAAYAYGGAEHSETILACCLWVADERENDTSQPAKKIDALERLASSIDADLDRFPPSLGRQGDSRYLGVLAKRESLYGTYEGTYGS